MTFAASLIFMSALFVTGYALLATIVPALPHIAELMADVEPVSAKPRLIYFGVERGEARRLAEAERLVVLKPRPVAPRFTQAARAQVQIAA